VRKVMMIYSKIWWF